VKKKLLTAQAAKILNLTPNAVRAMHTRGVLPAETTSNGVRLFDDETVRQLALKREVSRAASKED